MFITFFLNVVYDFKKNLLCCVCLKKNVWAVKCSLSYLFIYDVFVFEFSEGIRQ